MDSQVCEFLILQYALASEHKEGRSTAWAALRSHLWDAGVKISDQELMTTLQGARGELLIELRKWDDASGFVDFSAYADEDRFFWGQFCIRSTYNGKKHYERLLAAFAANAPVDNRPIGFTAG